MIGRYCDMWKVGKGGRENHEPFGGCNEHVPIFGDDFGSIHSGQQCWNGRNPSLLRKDHRMWGRYCGFPFPVIRLPLILDWPWIPPRVYLFGLPLTVWLVLVLTASRKNRWQKKLMFQTMGSPIPFTRTCHLQACWIINRLLASTGTSSILNSLHSRTGRCSRIIKFVTCILEIKALLAYTFLPV